MVLDSWFQYNASIENNDNPKNIESLIDNEYFDLKSPNTLRSILNAYVSKNSLFHSVDGSGYRFIAKIIIKFDKLNPIVISRFLKIFSRFRYYEEPYRKNMFNELNYIKKNKLSPNTREVIDSILN